jgi:hypothetical protein
MRTTRACVLSVSLQWLMSTAGATVQFDQANNAFPPGAYANIAMFQPVAQEFVPALDSIDFFDYWIKRFPESEALPTDVLLELRADSPFGEILGRSQRVTLELTTTGPSRFLFAGSLALIPGQTYSANLLTFDNNALQYGIRYVINDPYPAGDFYSGARQYTDAWFQEGVFIVPEPSVTSLILAAMISFFALRRRCTWNRILS